MAKLKIASDLIHVNRMLRLESLITDLSMNDRIIAQPLPG